MPKRIHIAAAAVRDRLILKRLSTEQYIQDESYISLLVLLEQLSPSDRDQRWSELAVFCAHYQDPDHVLDSMLHYPKTIDQLDAFIDQFYDEGWSLDDLPETNPKEKALKKLLKLVLDRFNHRQKQWDALFQQTASQFVVEVGMMRYAHQERLNRLIQNGAHLVKPKRDQPTYQVRFASNPRLEAEAVVEDMVQSKLPLHAITVVACDLNHLPYLKQALEAKGMPYHIPHERSIHPSLPLMGAVLKLVQADTHRNLRALLMHEQWTHPHHDALIDYLDLFELNLEELLSASSRLTQAGLNHLDDLLPMRDLQNLEQHAFEALTFYRKTLEQLLPKQEDLESTLIRCFDVVVDLSPASNVLTNLRDLIETMVPILKSLDKPYPYLMHRIAALSSAPAKHQGVVICALDEALVPHTERLYLIGATQENYPQLDEAKGLFDVAYLQAIQGYDPQARYQAHMHHLDELLTSAPQVVVSYNLGNFEGKARKLAVELDYLINDLALDAKAWPMRLVAESEPRSTMHLNPLTAQALFFKQNTLTGSVSSFERYFKCSYQYFLRHGLNLRPQPTLSFNPMWLGNLVHKLLERAIRNFGESYPEALKTSIDDELESMMDELRLIFPKKRLEFNRIQARLKDNLALLGEMLAEVEASRITSRRFKLEHRFDERLNVHPNYDLVLHGVIDRIDEWEGGFDVYDYKSSQKSLSQAKVAMGLQLQLPTYMMLAHQRLKLGEPLSMGYINLKQEPIRLSALKHSNKDKQAIPGDAPEQAWLKVQKPKVWDLSSYDPSAIEDHIEGLFRVMIETLSEGKLEKHHRMQSCQRCEFRSFCQFAKAQEKLPKVSSRTFKRGSDESD